MKQISLLALLLFLTLSYAQKKEDILLTLNDTEITADEFKRVYLKNLELVQDEEQKTVDGYLKLFIDYQIKAQEAKNLKYFEKESFQEEFASYEEQVSRTYLYEDRVIEEIAKEAYERNKEEIDASHILINAGYDALPSDTLVAYNKIKAIHERALKGEDFDKLAAEFSEEPNANNTKGRIGYFTAFSLVYPFETEAYNTKVGSVSNIVRTQFGYHIIKVHDRREKPEAIMVSHIYLAKASKDNTIDPKERIEELYQLYKEGTPFESIAKQYSEDKASAKNGGSLAPFRRGQLRSPIFENTTYALKNIGEVTQPFLSEFGWHIARLDSIIKNTTYEQEKENYIKKVKEGNRAKVVTSTIVNTIKEKYGFSYGDGLFQDAFNIVTDSIKSKNWKFNPNDVKNNSTLFTIGNQTVTLVDFLSYIETKQKKGRYVGKKEVMINNLYEEFENKTLKDYYRAQLIQENKDYRYLINEYKNGLMIFDLMQDYVWEAAKKDTLGQQNYFNARKGKYNWDTRVKANVFSTPSKEIINDVIAKLKEGEQAKDIRLDFNKRKINLFLDQGTYEIGNLKLPQKFEAKMGISKIYNQNDSFMVVEVTEILAPEPKTLEQVRGVIISEYQQEVEQKWMQQLREKYNVNVNQKALKKVKKEVGA